MPKAVIPIQIDLPERHPLLSTNAGEVQGALAAIERAVDDAIEDVIGKPVSATAIWVFRGTHRHTTTDAE